MLYQIPFQKILVPLGSTLTLSLLSLTAFPCYSQSLQTPSNLLKELEKPDIPLDEQPRLEFEKKQDEDKGTSDNQTPVFLKEISIDGNTVFPASDLKNRIDKLVGRTLTLGEIDSFVSELTADYRNRGYFLTAIAPVLQESATGASLSLRIVEGFIDDIILEPIDETVLGGPDQDRILAYAQRITESRPLHIDDIERGLLLIDDMPGIRVRSVIRPSKETVGAANLHLLIEQDEFSGVITANNRGSQTLGRGRLHSILTLNSLTGRSEQTRFNLSTIAPVRSEGEILHLGLTHRELIGNDGLSLTVHASGLQSEEGDELDELDVIGSSRNASVSLDYPFIRSRTENLYGSVRLNYSNQSTKLLHERILEDRVWSVSASGRYEIAGPGRLSRFTGSISKGLNLFDASHRNDPDLSREGGRPDFFKVNASFTHNQLLINQLVGTIRLAVQYAPHSLLSTEEFTLGGVQFGQAYQSSALAGDQALAASFEISRTYTLDSSITLQPFAYLDGGRVWNHNDQDDDSLASTGLGLRFNHDAGPWFDLSLNAPLVRDDLDDRPDRPRLFISGGFQF
ncbi:ShlB/FhaC/HecB family hemolysin secretion/activation protein [Kiloniella sp. b19]|uniref:ShlB/FhaC/HecB family hemolysin secretion/activation protein n=1 Tax=Kiloniella sp. GXU_MW_B19 TaxID=3141326 RepID=UPI0031E4421E